MKFAAIVACDQNWCIGRQGRIPWRNAEDMQFFKETTRGHVVIMGRKTYESIGRPLPNRYNIVLSTTMSPVHGVEVVRSVEQALAAAAEAVNMYAMAGVFVIGGGEIYRLFSRYTNAAYVTHLNAVVTNGDTYFPAIPWPIDDTREHVKDITGGTIYRYAWHNPYWHR